MTAPPPLVQLDPTGTATPISYNVPEPISYSGKNYLQLQLPDEAFRTVVTGPPAVSGGGSLTLTAGGAAAGSFRPQALITPQAAVPDAGNPSHPLVTSDAQPVTGRLAALTRGEVAATARAGNQTVLFRNVAGQLDFRTVAPLRKQDPDPGDPGSDPGPEYDGLTVDITAPAAGSWINGPAAGVKVTVLGEVGVFGAVEGARVTVQLDDHPVEQVQFGPDGRWSADVTMVSAGEHVIVATAVGSHRTGPLASARTITDTATLRVNVVLDGGGPVVQPPSVTITGPADRSTFVGSAPFAVDIGGHVVWASGNQLSSLLVRDVTSGQGVSLGPFTEGAESDWSTQLQLSDAGTHVLEVVATDDHGQASPTASVTVTLAPTQPYLRLVHRLMIVETMNLSSFLGAFGAGRCIKTFSLLPGERTTISVKSWTKSTETLKTGSSIVDSDAVESSDDFEDTLSAEQTQAQSLTEASNYSVSGSVSACWGWGNANISASTSGSANATRQNAVKNLSNATRKHAMKASSNRNVTINTEYNLSTETGQEESTTREISNVNVARVLNFVFRQMNQEHITLIHLSDVRIAVYVEDLMLQPDGSPAYVDDPDDPGSKKLDIRRTYRESELCALDDLLAAYIAPEWRDRVTQGIQAALTGVPDHQDDLHTIYETVTPKDADGNTVESATYIRFVRGLSQTYVDPVGGQSFTVPGIILNTDRIVMRTEGVLVDAVLGEGDGLDEYSHGLQDVSVAERQVGVAERQSHVAQMDLARQIIASKDTAAADLYAKVFPVSARPPVIDIVTSQNGTGSLAGASVTPPPANP